MFKFVKADFPESINAPSSVYKAVLIQKVYEHELMVLTFRDWNPVFETTRPGSPVQVSLVGDTGSRRFFGYVHHVQPNMTPGKRFTDVVCIGGTFPMKQASQQVYRDHTAGQVIKKMCIKHNLNYNGKAHPRKYPMISQAGYTDWQLAVRLAKQIGYTLRAENTDLYFEPILNDYALYREEAKSFYLRDEGSPQGSTLYKFTPMIGESLEYDGEMKAAVAISGVDRFSKSPVVQTKKKRQRTTKSKRQDEFFDRFNTLAVAPNVEIAAYEAEAAEARNSFPYRGYAEVIGDPSVRPNMPVFFYGLGSTYSGYWTVLGVEHVVTEVQRNVMSYTMNLTIGTDSLGSAQPWTDGSAVTAPTERPKRTIRPGVRQTKQKNTSTLQRKNVKANSRNEGSFGKINNRPKVTKNVKTPGTWRTSNPTKTITFTEKRIKSPTVAKRVRERNAR